MYTCVLYLGHTHIYSHTELMCRGKITPDSRC